jgi:hypothetical protein
MHSPQEQEPEQFRSWQEFPQSGSEDPDAHSPSPVQDPQVQFAWQVSVPQLPQARVSLGWQPSPVQDPQVQLPIQT